MACSPALAICTAWLPVTAPSERTHGKVSRAFHRRSAPRRARVCSIATEPRSRTTSAAE